MRAEELQTVRPGFHDPALGSQTVFRSALSALSHPGRAIELPAVADAPLAGHAAAAWLLLSLLDSDCRVWLSPSLANTDAAAWLRFHTGCILTGTPRDAGFLWIGAGDPLPAWTDLDAGTDEYPDQSATCVLEVPQLGDAPCGPDSTDLWLQGPGIARDQRLCAQGLPPDFALRWDANHRRFPRGVDLFLASATHIAGLPRTTRVRDAQEA